MNRLVEHPHKQPDWSFLEADSGESMHPSDLCARPL